MGFDDLGNRKGVLCILLGDDGQVGDLKSAINLGDVGISI